MPEFEPSPFDHQFARLVQLQEGTEADELFTELLRRGHVILDPLHAFLLRYPDEPDTAILVTLVAKTMEIRAITILLQLLDSPVPEIRKAAVVGLGWNRSVAALPHLDRIEGTDPVEEIAREACTAIEEILAQHPEKAGELEYHSPLAPNPTNGGNSESPPVLGEDQQRLMAAIPRLLALEFGALPLGFTTGGKLRIALVEGRTRAASMIIPELTGCEVEFEIWNREMLDRALGEFYHLGDDDFCLFHDRMTPLARRELIDLVLANVRAQEPSCPLDEANDAVEALQGFLSSCAALRVGMATIEYMHPHMTVSLHDEEGKAVYMGVPREKLRARFVEVLRFFAMEESGSIETGKSGEILCESSEPAFCVHYEETNLGNGVKIRLTFGYEGNNKPAGG